MNDFDVGNTNCYQPAQPLPSGDTIYVRIHPYNSLGVASGCPEFWFVTACGNNSVSLGKDTSFCAGGSLLLDPGPWKSYLWSTGATTPTITVSSAGLYAVEVRDSLGCPPVADTLIVGIYPAPGVSLTNLSPIHCNQSDGSITAAATGAAPFSYDWADLSGGNEPGQRSGLPAGNYKVTVTDKNGCTATASATLSEIPGPGAGTVPAATTCGLANGAVNLTVTGGTAPFQFIWSNNATTEDLSNIPAGIYTVTVTDSAGCILTLPASVNSSTPPAVTAGANPPTLCAGATISLTAGGGNTYSWTGPGGYTSSLQNPLRPSATPAMNGVYTVTVTDMNNCTATATASVVVNPLPQPAASTTPMAICTGANFTLNASGGIAYAWSGPGGFSSNQQNPQFPNANAAMSGAYTVTVTDSNGCSATTSIPVTVNALPQSSATAAPSAVCAGDDFALNASGGDAYAWSGPGGFSSNQQNPQRPNANAAMGGAYTVTVTDTNGCTASASTQVSVNPLPQPAATASPATACAGTPVAFGATGGSSYAWSGPAGFSSNQQNPQLVNTTANQSGLYTVTVTDANSCTATATASVTVNPLPQATASATPSTLCAGATISLTAAGGIAYAWSGPNGFSSNQQNPQRSNAVPGMAGTYIVSVSSNGCTATATTTVSVNPLPQATASTPKPDWCAGDTLQLNAAGGNTYAWSGPGGFTSSEQHPRRPDATPAMTGVYTVTVTDANGCTATATALATVSPGPALQPLVSPAHCGKADGKIDLSIAGAGPFGIDWADLTGTDDPEDRNGLAAGAYTVTVTDTRQCRTTASIPVNNLDGPTATALPTPAGCGQPNGNIDLVPNGGAPPLSFLWSNGAATEDLFNIAAGAYTVTITDAVGCSNVRTVTVGGPAPMEALNLLEDCQGADDSYRVTLALTGGTPPYTEISGFGNIAGNQFTGPVIASGAAYTYRFSDANNCPPLVVSGLHACNCLTAAGTMDFAPLIGCGVDSVDALHHQDQFLPPGTILLFVLHQGSGPILTNPIAWNTVPRFARTGSMMFGKPYYISAVAGPQNGANSIDLGNPCVSVAPGTPVTFFQAIFHEVKAAVCAGQGYPLGDTVFYTPGTHIRVLQSAAGCDSTVQLDLDVRQPGVKLGADRTICLGDTIQLIAQKVNCSGCPVRWNVPGSSDTLSVAPAGTGNYFVEIEDNIGCAARDTIVVAVAHSVIDTLNIIRCDSMPYFVGGKPYTQPGYYEIPLLSAAGCDSTVLLTLEFAAPKTYMVHDDTLFYPPGLGLSERQFNVVQNDGLPLDADWSTVLLSQPQAGTAELSPDGILIYRLSNTAFLGLDSFTYQLCDTLCTGVCSTGRIVLVVQDGLVDAAEEMPNAFTPNGDGDNDYFDPLAFFKDKKFITPSDRVSLTILNRWGEVVWHADPYSQIDQEDGWDGRSGTGKQVPQGTYYYMLRMSLGEKIVLKGSVMVLR